MYLWNRPWFQINWTSKKMQATFSHFCFLMHKSVWILFEDQTPSFPFQNALIHFGVIQNCQSWKLKREFLFSLPTLPQSKNEKWIDVQGWGFCEFFSICGFFFGQPMQDFEWAHINYLWLHAVLTQIGWGWIEICVVTAQIAGFFFKICPPSLDVSCSQLFKS